jgi:acetyl-CoA carboxylase biotin carboxyl carrier protein
MLQAHRQHADIGADMSSAAHESGSGDDRRLSQLTTTARLLAFDMPGPLRRIAVQLDGARVEMEWEDGARDRLDVIRPAGGLMLAPPIQGTDPSDDLAAIVVRSPLVGTFYHAPAPGELPFVTVGTTVGPDTVIGIVEAMKLMNHIAAEHHGIVRSVLLADCTPVEFDQPLVLLDPVAGELDPVAGEEQADQDGGHPCRSPRS